jgi:fructose-bisphosphate aldolase/6-deoxy-5-ketofructose 1-phosphate synthase
MFFKKSSLFIPADVPCAARCSYTTNMLAITKRSENLLLFAVDQKMEHLNNDFYGPTIPLEVNLPANIFSKASRCAVGAFATHFGLVARYGKEYPQLNYIIKLNGKTDLIKTEQRDPLSTQLWSVADVVRLKKISGLPIRGIGYTIYLGSEFEHIMLEQAAQAIWQAHQHGLIAIVWIYPRGKSVAQEKNINVIAGAAGVAASLGADFVKINPPQTFDGKSSAQLLTIATQAAGTTKVICSGGSKKEIKELLYETYEQITIGKTHGAAIGRNIFQRPEAEAIALSKALHAIIYEKKDAEYALKMYTNTLAGLI